MKPQTFSSGPQPFKHHVPVLCNAIFPRTRPAKVYKRQFMGFKEIVQFSGVYSINWDRGSYLKWQSF